MIHANFMGHALVISGPHLDSRQGKTTHGLIRGSSRFMIDAVIASGYPAASDAGTILDGVPRNIPVFATIEEALNVLPQKPQYAINGVANAGGRLCPELRSLLADAARQQLHLVSGLHTFLADDPELAQLAHDNQCTIIDIRKTPPPAELHFWTGASKKLAIPRIAVMGTDCAVGKRTTAYHLLQELRTQKFPAEMIYTGQTGWLQGEPYGILFDALPNDFVCGELEHAVLECARIAKPKLILIEGQSALLNPSGPCGSEFILAAGAQGIILQTAPHRKYFDGFGDLSLKIPSLAANQRILTALGSEVLAITVNPSHLSKKELDHFVAQTREELQLPVLTPLQDARDSISLCEIVKNYSKEFKNEYS